MQHTTTPDQSVVHLWSAVPIAETQGTLALDLQPRHDPPFGLGAPSPQRGDDGGGAVVPIDARQRRGVSEWARRFTQAAVEIVGGDRPASQLVRWTDPEVYADLERRAALVSQAGGHQPGAGRVQPVRPRIRSVHTCLVRPDVVEVSAHVRYGGRSRALAARFEQRDQRWLCTALEFA